MIKVIIYTSFSTEKASSSTRYLHGYEISGHAGFAKHGKDIVCAAVSVLGINTANAIAKLTTNSMDIKTGDSGYLKVIAKDIPDSMGQLLLETFVLGIQSIYDDYGKKHIHIQFEEV